MSDDRAVPLHRRLARNLMMVRHVPPAQLWRRLVLQARYRLGPGLDDAARHRPPPPADPAPPGPVMPPRRLLEPHPAGDRLVFRQPWGEMELSRPIDWRLPAKTAEDAAVTASWRANLHYMEYLEGVDETLFAEIVADWIEANPRRAPDAWRCAWRPYNLSIRVVVWMQQIARRRDRLKAGFLAEAEASLAGQLRFLERHLETDIQGNHLIRNIRALLWAGRFFAGEEAAGWRRRASGLLGRELERQILDDGCHYELSPSYHCQVMGDLLDCFAILDDGPLRAALAGKLEAMAGALTRLTHPDGLVALFNDGGLGMAYRPDELLAAFTELLGDTVTPEDGVFALGDAGYFGCRRSDDYLLVDCGPIGPDALIGHGHGDILSFEWSIGGRRMIVDQGTFQHDDDPRRRASRATASHNTVTIDEGEQCDFFGAHRCGRRAYPELRRFEETAKGFVLGGTHDGFRTLEGAPRHVRHIEARHIGTQESEVSIRDRVAGRGRHKAIACFLLHPDCRLVGSDATSLIVERDGLLLEIAASIPIGLEPAEWFPDLYVALPTSRVVLESPLLPAGPEHVIETRLRRLETLPDD